MEKQKYSFVSEKDAKCRCRVVEWFEDQEFMGEKKQKRCTDILDTETGKLITNYNGKAEVNYLGNSEDLVIVCYDGLFSAPFDLSTGEFLQDVELKEYNLEDITDYKVSTDKNKCLLTVERDSSSFDKNYVDHYFEVDLGTKKVEQRDAEFLNNYENCMAYGLKKKAAKLKNASQPNND